MILVCHHVDRVRVNRYLAGVMTNDATFFDEIVLVEFLGQGSAKSIQKYTRPVLL